MRKSLLENIGNPLPVARCDDFTTIYQHVIYSNIRKETNILLTRRTQKKPKKTLINADAS